MTAAEYQQQYGGKGKSPPREQKPAATPRTPPALHSEPQQSGAFNQRPKTTEEQTRDAKPRPRFSLTNHEQYGGFRFVAHSINEEQARALCQAAEKAGIQEQN